jgi:hypothetical protein
MSTTLFRIVRTNPASRSDFWPDVANGLPPRGAQRDDIRCWVGVFLFDDERRARERAQRYKLGRYIATLEFPDAGPFFIEDTLGRGHYSVIADPETLRTLVVHVVQLESI